jgi:tRNA(Arg) A34 adenosine deaminase TadA
MSELNHERYMRRAIDLTTHCPTLPFGAVIVHRPTGRVVAEGWNRTHENPTWHGEIDAINHLTTKTPALDAADLVLYTTAEPCPMCQGAVLFSGIGMVVFGVSIRFLVEVGWNQIEIPAEELVRRTPGVRCLVIGGVLEDECRELFLTIARSAPGR